ncbi:MAG: S-layer homology domain-containing protein, partial [Moorellales bacterium]
MLVRALARADKAPALAAGEAETLLSRYSDRGRVSAWARGAVAAAVHSGLMQGRTATTFNPGESCTRAEAAVLLKRLMERVD